MSNKKRFGPYKSNYGHLFYCDLYENGTKKSVWVHRELMEHHLGRKLLSNEHVHHKNEIKTDNRLENLEVLDFSEHMRYHRKPPEWFHFVCPECGGDAVKLNRYVKHNKKLGKAGPFCGRSCAGKYGKKIQMGVYPNW